MGGEIRLSRKEIGVGLDLPEVGELPFHPLYRTLICANSLFSYDRTDIPAYARRIREQIGVLEFLRERRVCSKQELLPFFNKNEMGLYRYLNPLCKIGLLRKEKKDGELVFHFDTTVQLDLAEESRRVQHWLSERNQHSNGTVTVETPVGFLKLQPAAQAEQITK